MPKLINQKSQKYTFWLSDIDYRVASLSEKYLIAKLIIPESLKSIEQF